MKKTIYLKDNLEFFDIEEWICKGMDLNPSQKLKLEKFNLSTRKWTILLNGLMPVSTDDIESVSKLTKIPKFALLMTKEDLERYKPTLIQQHA
jgi:hypothetical protein